MYESGEKLRILVIDDDELVRRFIVSLCEERDWLAEEAENGPQGVEMVRKNSSNYQVALLDLRMPGPTGLEILSELQKYSQDLAVIMMSGYAEVSSAVEAMKKGAYDLLQKPIEPGMLETRVEKAVEQRQLRIEHRQYVEDIEQKVNERTAEVEEARKAIIFGLARLTESRDRETGYHLERMANYVIALGEDLRKRGLYRDILSDDYLDQLYDSAPLHDIGKVGVPDAILLKPGKLTEKEFDIMKTHTEIGAKAIEDIQKKENGHGFLPRGMEMALGHHEHYDGTGYPHGQKGKDISLAARILALGDFYDALSFPRIYRPFACPHEEVREMIEKKAETQFDPDIVESFIGCEGRFESLRQQYQN